MISKDGGSTFAFVFTRSTISVNPIVKIFSNIAPTHLILTTSCLIDSETSFDELAKCCHVDGSLFITTKFFAALTTVQELSINRLPESMIGCWARLA